MKHVPNLLSAGRIAAAFFLLSNHRLLFLVCYILCGLTDVLDGFIARRHHVETPFGAKLDSLGDFVFWMMVGLQLYTRTNVFTVWSLAGMVAVAGIRLLNLLITKVKFRQWAMLHTRGNKITGLALYFACFAAFLLDGMQWYVWLPVWGLALLSSVEETVMVCSSRYYDPNPKGFFPILK